MLIDKLKMNTDLIIKVILTGHQVKAIKGGFLEKLMAYLNIANDCKNSRNACYVSINSKGDAAYYTSLKPKTGYNNFQSSINSSVLLQDGTLIAITQSGNKEKHHII